MRWLTCGDCSDMGSSEWYEKAHNEKKKKERKKLGSRMYYTADD